jgi:hypothetical protein
MIAGSLHIRSVCDNFEKSIKIIVKQNRKERCAKVVKLKETLMKQELDIASNVPQIAMDLLSKLNNKAVHGDYQGSGHNLVVITSFFLLDELKLIKAMVWIKLFLFFFLYSAIKFNFQKLCNII